MPDSFATLCGGMLSSQNAWMIAAVIESWPQPAQSVVIAPFVVAAGQPDGVRLQRRMVDLGFRDVGHATFSSFALTPLITWCALIGKPA